MAKWGSCDFRELEKLQKRLEKMEKQRKEFCEMCARELAGRLHYLAGKRTPVGVPPRFDGPKTVRVKVRGHDGKVRNRAFLSADAARYKQYWAGYTGGKLRRGWTIGANVEKKGDVYQIEVINPVLYASYVEYGHRQEPGRYVPALGKQLKRAWVPGQFMLTVSEKQVQRSAPAILEKKLQKFLEDCLDAK